MKLYIILYIYLFRILPIKESNGIMAWLLNKQHAEYESTKAHSVVSNSSNKTLRNSTIKNENREVTNTNSILSKTNKQQWKMNSSSSDLSSYSKKNKSQNF